MITLFLFHTLPLSLPLLFPLSLSLCYSFPFFFSTLTLYHRFFFTFLFYLFSPTLFLFSFSLPLTLIISVSRPSLFYFFFRSRSLLLSFPLLFHFSPFFTLSLSSPRTPFLIALFVCYVRLCTAGNRLSVYSGSVSAVLCASPLRLPRISRKTTRFIHGDHRCARFADTHRRN